ncbi:SPOR domain-containing protein [Alloprevotella tannerae]|uniref:SPOR domain-containing protein n=1 Tax=Alloprevotella tannerae TaxID=76122 RepID=UPI0028EDCAAC|nr:SPOR domain-containing protein [Alloprevotella tannerae]
MTRIGGLLIVFILTSVCATAQTFTDHARKQNNGGGRLTVVQDTELDNIVNNKRGKATQTTQTVKKAEAKPAKKADVASDDVQKKNKASDKPTANTAIPATKPASTVRSSSSRQGNYYVARQRVASQGYRIQIYTGGNSRNDKNEAQQMRVKCQQQFPELAAYVHFISPHWVCRVGDFNTRESAARYVSRLRKARISYEVRIVSSPILAIR